MMLEEIKTKIVSALKISQADFSFPLQTNLGDLSLSCFSLAKELGLNPGQAAQELAKRARDSQELAVIFSQIEAVGPYLNFFISPRYLAGNILAEIRNLGGRYGSNQVGAGQRIMIEYSNGNTHKEYHIGHLRNIAYGDSICHLLAASGYEVIPVSYINDFGIHVAKTIWQWRRQKDYRQRSGSKGYILGQCYADASRALAAEESQSGQEEVARIMAQIESRQGDNYQVWQETRRWSIEYFSEIYRELGVKFKHTFYESEVINDGLKMVADLEAKGIFKKSEGALIADLEDYGLGVLPIIRSNGTALYAVADLALASEKFRRFSLNESIYIVDIRQSLYLKQLFKILELAGFSQRLVHLPYDFVTLPEGMMASRTGNVISYEMLRDKVQEKLRQETASRHPDWSAAKIESVASDLGIATIKFEMLKVSPDKVITFNIQEALRFDGYTACYLEYGYARLKSIIRKHRLKDLFRAGNPNFLSDPKEKELLLKMAKYPHIVWAARQHHDPSQLAKYLFELVQIANDYYHSTNILKAEPEMRRARIILIKATLQVLENGFAVLGMKALAEI